MNSKKIAVILKSATCLFLFLFIGYRFFIPVNDVQPDFSVSSETNGNIVSSVETESSSSPLMGTAQSNLVMRTLNGGNNNLPIYSVAKTSQKPVFKKAVTAKAKTAVKKEMVIHATRADVSVKPFKVYLSPSCQTWNPYCDGSGSEEYHMRQIASAMPAYLKQYGIQSVLAAPQTGTQENQRATIVSRVKQAADAKCDLYLAIHSNASDGGPKTSGTTIYYPSQDAKSLRFAQLIAGNFNYYDKSAISLDTKDALWEMYMPKMPHCLIETAYHDNDLDVQWIEGNTEEIAQNLARCIALEAYVPVGISMDKTQVSVKAGKTCDRTAKVTLINKSVNNNLTVWSSSNEKVAKVKNGTILGITPGKAVITACTSNHLTAKCSITVQK